MSLRDKKFFAGWGFKDEILPKFFSNVDFDVVAWSLGIVRFDRFLRENCDVVYEKALFVTCQEVFPQEEARRFIDEFCKNPISCLTSFYRKVFWGVKQWKTDYGKFIFLSAKEPELKLLENQIKELVFHKVDTDLIKKHCKKICVVVAKKDLIVPYSNQCVFAKKLCGEILKVNAGHFCFPSVRYDLDRIKSSD